MTVHKVLDGRYELGGLLGVGGTGEIYDGWDTRLDRPVAVKLLRREVGSRPDMRRRFDVEARATAALTHPCIVAVYDTGEYDGRPYIVMERLPGRTLADDIARGPLSADRVRTVLAEVLEALVAAHEAGILHRDVKPANVLIAENGDIKVADFGIAKGAGDDLTRTGELVGTVAYLSPDRITGHPASVADDLYALGVVGYEALCGRRPFTEDNILALARAITHEQPKPLADVRPDAPPGLVAVIERAMTHGVSDRFGSAREMLAALNGSDGHRGAATTRLPADRLVGAPPVAIPAAHARTDRPPGVLLAAGLTLVGAIIVGGLALGFGRDTTSPPAATPETLTPGTFASDPRRVPVTTDAPETVESVAVPASTAAETPMAPPAVSVPEYSPAPPTVDLRPGPTESDSRGNNGNSNNGNGGNGNNGNGNGNGNSGNGNRGNGNGG